jgi:hypothetical protein
MNDQNNAAPRPAGAMSFSPLDILKEARAAVPAVDYALGAAGIAAAGSIVVAFVGHDRAAIIILGGMFIAMILLFAFARLVAAQDVAINRAGIALLWMVTVFFGTFLLFTTTAVAFNWPQAWAQILGIDLEPDSSFNKKTMDKLLEIPKDASRQLDSLNSRVPIGLVRIQPRLPDPVEFAKREAAMIGSGSYYSFISQKHEYGSDSNIELEPALFKTGFAGADYGFFMYNGQGSLDEIVSIDRNAPPARLDEAHLSAWKYFWDYRPPSDIKKIRDEQKKSQRGFTAGKVTLLDQVAVNNGGSYLLRSILIKQSDILVAFYVLNTLSDGSAVFAWRTLKVFDAPIATGHED